jgi:hypothetical protein
MNIKQLNRELRDLLKEFIESEDHIDTGALYRSIKFDCKFDNGVLDMKFSSEEYIVYLEEGNFVDRFFELSKVLDAIGDFYAENIDLGL